MHGGLPRRLPRIPACFGGGVVRVVLSWLRQFWTAILRAFGQFATWIAWPFRMLWRLFWRQNRWFKVGVAVVLAPFVLGYVHFIWNAAWIRGYDIDYIQNLGIENRVAAPGSPIAGSNPAACGRSYIVDATADLIDLTVNRNLWLPSNPFYKAGFFFLLDWQQTKFFDNKAAFELGVKDAIGRTVIELTDVIGRVRGTTAADNDLNTARGQLQFDEYTWAFNPFSERPFGPTTRTPTYYENAREALLRYQDRLVGCDARFDPRADNLLVFLDRISVAIGSLRDGLLNRTQTHHSGWFDTQADNLFMNAKGQMYAYYGILEAARADFAEIVESRQLTDIWDRMMGHFREVLQLDPMIISNGRDDAWIMPNHVTTIGFYIGNARDNIEELTDVLAQ